VKLKLESIDEIKVLTVSEEITPQHAAVLQAGLTKLFSADETLVLLDLTGVSEVNSETLIKIGELRMVAANMDATLAIASAIPGFGDATTREEVLTKLQSPLAKFLSNEAKLQAKFQRLTRKKEAVEQKLHQHGGHEEEIKDKKKRNSDLRANIRRLEAILKELSATREDEPADTRALQMKATTLDQTLTAVLEQEGVLPVT